MMAAGSKPSTLRVVLVLLLSLTAIACLGFGALPAGDIGIMWYRHGLVFNGLEGIQWLAGLFGVGLMAVGLLAAGIALRLSWWRKAPIASLCLAVFSAMLMGAMFAVFFQSEFHRQHGGMPLLAWITGGGLVLSGLPPLLHWLLATRSRAGLSNLSGDL